MIFVNQSRVLDILYFTPRVSFLFCISGVAIVVTVSEMMCHASRGGYHLPACSSSFGPGQMFSFYTCGVVIDNFGIDVSCLMLLVSLVSLQSPSGPSYFMFASPVYRPSKGKERPRFWLRSTAQGIYRMV